MFDYKGFAEYLKNGGTPSSLERHDAQYHPEGYNPEESHCRFRDRMSKEDAADVLAGKDFGNETVEAVQH